MKGYRDNLLSQGYHIQEYIMIIFNKQFGPKTVNTLLLIALQIEKNIMEVVRK